MFQELAVHRVMPARMSKPKGTLKSLQTRLCRLVGQAIGDFSMIEHGDRVMVCLSGGKDSYGLLDILLALQKKAPIDFELIAVNVDQKQPGFPVQILPEYLTKLGVPFHIEEQDTYSVVKELIPEGKTMCSLCSRLRRGVLYRLANELGVTKIALGHHRDDLVETLFLNMFLKGNFASMPPKLLSQDGQHVVIRPLAYVEESDLASYASFNLETAVGRKKAVQAIGVHGEIQKGVVTLVVMSHFWILPGASRGCADFCDPTAVSRFKDFPLIPCNLCGSQENLKRQEMKKLAQYLNHKFPGCVDNILSSMGRVKPERLMDRTLFNFVTMQTQDREGMINEDLL